MQNIRGYYDRGKLSSIQVAKMELIYWPVRLSSRRGEYEVKGGVESFFYPAASFILLENRKIWCKIQVIIYPSVIVFLKKYKNFSKKTFFITYPHVTIPTILNEVFFPVFILIFQRDVCKLYLHPQLIIFQLLLQIFSKQNSRNIKNQT